jgi:hypothetical protein
MLAHQLSLRAFSIVAVRGRDPLSGAALDHVRQAAGEHEYASICDLIRLGAGSAPKV